MSWVKQLTDNTSSIRDQALGAAGVAASTIPIACLIHFTEAPYLDEAQKGIHPLSLLSMAPHLRDSFQLLLTWTTMLPSMLPKLLS